MAEAPFDVGRAHRWFAVELNNLAWEYVEAPSRSDEDVQRMIHASHGACFHWLEVGDLLNHLRAQSLLATVYVTAGYPEAAVRHAQACLQLAQQAGEKQTAFDRACVHGSAAMAFQLAGDKTSTQQHSQALETACQAITDKGDIKVIDKLYRTPLTSGQP